MSVNDKITRLYNLRYASKGFSLPMLSAVVNSIAKHFNIPQDQLERRLENVEHMIKKLPDGPKHG